MRKIIVRIALFLVIAAFPVTDVFAAIAHSASHGRNNGSGTSVSLASVATSGSDRLLVCSILAEANGTTVSSGPTFGGSNFTQLGPYVDTDDGAQSYSIWYLVAPSTSSGSISATLSASTPWSIWCDSWTGVAQTATFGTPTWNAGALGTPLDIQRTSSTTDSWMFVGAKEDSASTALNISAGGARRENGPLGAGNVTSAHFDSNAAIANSTTHTMTLTWTGSSQKIGYVAAMMAPAVAPASITGSGTANRLAKFTATTTLANALLSDDGSNTTLTSGNFLMAASSILDTITNGAISFGTSMATTMTFGRSGQNMIINSNVGIGTSTPSSKLHVEGDLKTSSLSTVSNCVSSASPAVCGSAPAGSVAMATGGDTLVVNTTAVTANSQIMITEDSSLGSRLGLTCNTVVSRTYTVSARTAGTSFTIKSSNNPNTNKACLSYWIVN